MFTRSSHCLHIFPPLALVACFPALGTGCMFTRAWQSLYVFPRLTQLHIFLRLASVACFPALGMFFFFFFFFFGGGGGVSVLLDHCPGVIVIALLLHSSLS